jgi:hypothetical protein
VRLLRRSSDTPNVVTRSVPAPDAAATATEQAHLWE